MSVLLSIVALFTFYSEPTASQSIVITGSYQGKNLFVQNPFAGNMKDFCVDEVYVNNVKVMDNIKSSAFEIDLSTLNENDAVTVKINHKDDCKPKVLNAQVIRAGGSFMFTSFTVTDKEISWSVRGDRANNKIYVEQFLYNNWVVIKELNSKPSATSNSNSTYTTTPNHHSGLNKYRIRVQEKEGNSFYSKTFEYVSTLPEVTFFPKRVSNKIYLSQAVDYEIIDGYGTPLLKGKGKEIPCESLTEGVYYLNIDNKTEKFLKK